MAYAGPTGPKSIQYTILHDYNFAPFEETVFEEWELDNDNLVDRFARQDHLISCYFLIDPELVP